MKSLELRIPPPALTALCALAMWLCAYLMPAWNIEFSMNTWVAIGFAVGGILIDLAGFFAFRRQRTTINPLSPDRTTALVAKGIYRYTRNPMYLGLLLLLTAWALWLSSLIAFIFLPVFVVYLTRFQIMPEERILGQKFGAAYADYCRNVRRWI